MLVLIVFLYSIFGPIAFNIFIRRVSVGRKSYILSSLLSFTSAGLWFLYLYTCKDNYCPPSYGMGGDVWNAIVPTGILLGQGFIFLILFIKSFFKTELDVSSFEGKRIYDFETIALCSTLPLIVVTLSFMDSIDQYELENSLLFGYFFAAIIFSLVFFTSRLFILKRNPNSIVLLTPVYKYLITSGFIFLLIKVLDHYLLGGLFSFY